jgi:hypothetical protein
MPAHKHNAVLVKCSRQVISLLDVAHQHARITEDIPNVPLWDVFADAVGSVDYDPKLRIRDRERQRRFCVGVNDGLDIGASCQYGGVDVALYVRRSGIANRLAMGVKFDNVVGVHQLRC